VDRDAAAKRDVSLDLVARNGRAALRKPDEDVLDARDDDAERRPRDDPLARGRLCRDHRFLGDVVDLEPLEHLVDDVPRADLPRSEREVEVLGLLEPQLADHRREHARSLQLAVGQVLRLESLVERLAALLLGLSPRLALEPLADLVAGARRASEREPVA
jgi:hypothetical protein